MNRIIIIIFCIVAVYIILIALICPDQRLFDRKVYIEPEPIIPEGVEKICEIVDVRGEITIHIYSLDRK